MIFSKVRNRHILIHGLVLLVLSLLLLVPLLAGAQEGSINEGNQTGDVGMSGEIGYIMKVVWNFAAKLLYIFFVAIPVFIASLAGILFNVAVIELVVGMGDLINNDTGIGAGINNLWTVIRDVMNILFIFGLIYIGLKTIWDADNANTRRTLGLLIAAALLINFSLFISKAVVDFTNLAAYEICELMSCTGDSSTAGALGRSFTGLSGAFFEATGVSTLVSRSLVSEYTSDSTWSVVTSEAMQMFMVMILFIVLTVVFIGGAVMLFTRFIALILYMIFSPIMFLGWILPSFKRYQDQWWNGFFQKAFFAPLFLFMLYVSLISVQQMRAGLSGRDSGERLVVNYQDAINASDAGAFLIFMVYAFAIGMLIASIVVAQRFSIAGAGVTMGALQGARNRIQNGITSSAYRNTAGRYYNARLKKIDELDRAAQAGDSTAKRRLRLMAATSGYGTVAGMRAAAEKGKAYGAGGLSYSDIEKSDKERKGRAARAQKVVDIKTALRTGTEAERRKALADATDAQLIEIAKSSSDRDLLTDDKNVGLVSGNQIQALEKSDDVDDAFVGEIQAKKSTATSTTFNRAAGTAGSKKVEDANVDELGALGFEKLKDERFAVQLDEDKIDKLKINDQYKDQLKENRKDALVKLATGGAITTPDGTKLDHTYLNTKDITKLPKNAFGDNTFTKQLNVSQIKNIKRADIAREVRDVLEKEIKRVGLGTGNKQIDAVNEWFTRNSDGQTFGK